MPGFSGTSGWSGRPAANVLPGGEKQRVVCPACHRVKLSCGAREKYLDFVREYVCVWRDGKPAFSDRGLCARTRDAGALRSFWMGYSRLGRMGITAGSAFSPVPG